MMVVIIFQLIFLNKTKYSSCRDLSPNRLFQELKNDFNFKSKARNQLVNVLSLASEEGLPTLLHIIRNHRAKTTGEVYPHSLPETLDLFFNSNM